MGLQVDYDIGAKKLGDYTITMGVDNDDITCHAAVYVFQPSTSYEDVVN